MQHLRDRQNLAQQPAPVAAVQSLPAAAAPVVKRLGPPIASLPAPPPKPQRGEVPPTDTWRIVNLPVVHLDGEALCDPWNARLCRPGGSFKLRPIQAACFEALHHEGGLAGPVGVGHGKTIVVLLASVVLQRKHAIVITTAPNVPGMRATYYHDVKPNFLTSPVDPIFISFDDLSTPRPRDALDLLEELAQGIDPADLVIAVDEAHHLKDPKSARTFRFLSFCLERPQIAVVVVSGTLIGQDIAKAAHLFGIALRERSPLPLDDTHLRSWAECVNLKGKPAPSDWARIEPLWQWAGHTQPIRTAHGTARTTAIQQAFQKRYRCAPGVVASQEGSLGTALNIVGVDPGVSDEVLAALTALTDASEDPNGDPITDDVVRWRLGRYLSVGFYYVYDWPGEPDDEYLQAKRAWGRLVRRELEFRRARGYDSEARVAAKLAEDIAKGRRPTALHQAWIEWQKVLPRWGTAGPPNKAVWLSHDFVNHAVAWAKSQKKPAILWYESLAVEAALRQCGLPVYGQGSTAPEFGRAEPHTCAMSIEVHGTGKNLQNFERQYLVEIPPNAESFEQLLGRLHRPGQVADEVTTVVPQHTDPYCDTLRKVRALARAVENYSGNQQKLNYANYIGIR